MKKWFLLLILMLPCFPVVSATSPTTSTVYEEYPPITPYYVDKGTAYEWHTTYGIYNFSKVDGTYSYTWRNGTLLAPSVKFNVQYLVGDSWEDNVFTGTKFTVFDDAINFLQYSNNGTLEVIANFYLDQPPKLSCNFKKSETWNRDFRIVFKVTVPQAWTYFYKNYDEIAEIPKTDLQYRGSKIVILNTANFPYDLGLVVDWSDFGVTDAILKGSTIRVIFPTNLEKVDPSTVATSNYAYMSQYAFQRKVWYANGLWWIFYTAGSTILYKTSSDGQSWSSSSTIVTMNDPYTFSTWHNGTHFYYARDDGRFRQGILNSDGSISWTASEQIFRNIGTERPFVSVDSDGYPFVGFTDTSTDTPYITKSSLNNGSWSTQTGFPIQLSTSELNWAVPIVPLTEGKMYLIYSKGNEVIKGKLWTGSAWGSEETITSSTPFNGFTINVASLNDDVLLVFLSSGSPNLIFVRRKYESGWSNEFTLASVSQGIGGCGGIISLSTSGFVVSFPDYENFCYTNYYEFFQPKVNWLISSGLSYSETFTGINEAVSDIIAIIWVSGSASPYSLKFTTFTVPSSPTPFIPPASGETPPPAEEEKPAPEEEPQPTFELPKLGLYGIIGAIAVVTVASILHQTSKSKPSPRQPRGPPPTPKRYSRRMPTEKRYRRRGV